MSWDAYVDGQLLGTHTVSHGAILGLDGSVWAAKGAGGAWAVREGAALAALFNPDARGQSFSVGGEKYMIVTYADSPPTLYFKKGTSGGAAMKCTQCIVIGVYRNPEQGEASFQAGKCNTAVGKLADYLIENGY